MRYILLSLFPLLVACGASPLVNTSGTLAADNQQIVTEAAQIRATLQVEETHVLSTAVAAETLVAQENVVNAVLLATVRAGEPPTVQVRAQLDRSVGNLRSGAPTPEGVLASGQGPAGVVAETYLSSDIRDADGCGADRSTQFELGIFRIYAIQRVQNIPANTLIGIVWTYNGETVLTDQLLVTESASDLCVWFYLEPYSSGDWAVQFSSNGVPVGDRVGFQVVQ